MFGWGNNGEKPPDLAPPLVPDPDLEKSEGTPAAVDNDFDEIEVKEVIGSSRDRFKSLFARARIPFVPRKSVRIKKLKDVKMEARLRRDLEKQCMSEIIKASMSEDIPEEDLLIRIQNRSSPKPVAMQIGENEIIKLESNLEDVLNKLEADLKGQGTRNRTVEEEQMVDGKISDCDDEEEQGNETGRVNRVSADDEITPMDARGEAYEKFEDDVHAETMKYILVSKEKGESGVKEDSVKDSSMFTDEKDEFKVDSGIFTGTTSYARILDRSISKLPFLRYIPKPSGQKPGIVEMPIGEIMTGSAPFFATLVGYFVGNKLPYPTVSYNVKKLWRKFGIEDVMVNEQGFFFFKFNTFQGMMDVLDNGPWHIQNIPIFLQQWKIGMSLNKSSVDKVPVWVNVYNVPLEYWNDNGVSYIASELGKPITMDSMTKTTCENHWGRPGFMRILVEVAADKEWFTEIGVASRDMDTGEKIITMCKVDYSWRPLRCSHCKVYGHKDDSCQVLIMKKAEEKKEEEERVKREEKGKEKVTEEDDGEGEFIVVKKKKGKKNTDDGSDGLKTEGKKEENEEKGNFGLYLNKLRNLKKKKGVIINEGKADENFQGNKNSGGYFGNGNKWKGNYGKKGGFNGDSGNVYKRTDVKQGSGYGSGSKNSFGNRGNSGNFNNGSSGNNLGSGSKGNSGSLNKGASGAGSGFGSSSRGNSGKLNTGILGGSGKGQIGLKREESKVEGGDQAIKQVLTLKQQYENKIKEEAADGKSVLRNVKILKNPNRSQNRYEIFNNSEIFDGIDEEGNKVIMEDGCIDGMEEDMGNKENEDRGNFGNTQAEGKDSAKNLSSQ